MQRDFSIQNDEVHLWRVDVDYFLSDADKLHSILVQNEIQRAEAFFFQNQKLRFIIARAFLRKILALYIQKDPKTIEFFYGSQGKPYLQNAPLPIFFNLSHSNNLILYAITLNHEIGIDIQQIRPYFNEKVAQRFFSSDEYLSLMAQPLENRHLYFYELWSAKEAMIKALGQGLFNHELNTNFEIHKFLIDSQYVGAIARLPFINKIVSLHWCQEIIYSSYAEFLK